MDKLDQEPYQWSKWRIFQKYMRLYLGRKSVRNKLLNRNSKRASWISQSLSSLKCFSRMTISRSCSQVLRSKSQEGICTQWWLPFSSSSACSWYSSSPKWTQMLLTLAMFCSITSSRAKWSLHYSCRYSSWSSTDICTRLRHLSTNKLSSQSWRKDLRMIR